MYVFLQNISVLSIFWGRDIDISTITSTSTFNVFSPDKKVENLAYFMRFAQAALSKAAADMERAGLRGIAGDMQGFRCEMGIG